MILDCQTEEPRSHGVSAPVPAEIRTRGYDQGSDPRDDIVAFGRFRLSATERVLEKDGARLKLGSRALDILIALIERAPNIVSKRELLARVWPDLIVDEGSLRFHISALRKVLGDGQSGARYVTNVSGRGYCFAAPVWRAVGKHALAEYSGAGQFTTPPRYPDGAGSLGAVAGAIAHDFNNILGAILGYGELAQSAASAGDPTRRYADNIMLAGQHIYPADDLTFRTPHAYFAHGLANSHHH